MEQESPRIRKIHKKGYVMNKAAKETMYEKDGLWYVPVDVKFARRIEDEERAEIEEKLMQLVNKKTIARDIGTNIYQLNRALTRWYGSYNYKDVIRQLNTDDQN